MDRKWRKDRHSELSFSQENREYLSPKNICNIIKKAEEQWGSWSGSQQALGEGQGSTQAAVHPLIHPSSHSLNPFVPPDDGLNHVIPAFRLRCSSEDVRGPRCSRRCLDLKNYLLKVILRALKSDSERKGGRRNELKSQA